MTIQDFPPQNHAEKQMKPVTIRALGRVTTYSSPYRSEENVYFLYPFGVTFTAIDCRYDNGGNVWYRVRGSHEEWVNGLDVEVVGFAVGKPEGEAEAEEPLDARTIARRLAKLRRSLAHEQGGWSLDDQALMWDVAKTLGLSPIQCAYVAGDPEAMWAAAEEELGL